MKSATQARPTPRFAWSAPDLAAYDKSMWWYVTLGIITMATSALILVLTRDRISSISIIVVGIFLAILASRRPHTIRYEVDQTGITIAGRKLQYEELRFFSHLPHGEWNGIILKPTAPFAFTRAIFYEPKHEAKIVGLLESHVAAEEHSVSALDRLMQRMKL